VTKDIGPLLSTTTDAEFRRIQSDQVWSRRFRWVLLMRLKVVRFAHAFVSMSCPFHGPRLSHRPKKPGSTRLT
jgi:hypothetical protein